jgi:galactitol-specific phosphotransferase system IIC component
LDTYDLWKWIICGNLMYISSLDSRWILSLCLLRNVVLLVTHITICDIHHTDLIYNTTELCSIVYSDVHILVVQGGWQDDPGTEMMVGQPKTTVYANAKLTINLLLF